MLASTAEELGELRVRSSCRLKWHCETPWSSRGRFIFEPNRFLPWAGGPRDHVRAEQFFEGTWANACSERGAQAGCHQGHTAIAHLSHDRTKLTDGGKRWNALGPHPIRQHLGKAVSHLARDLGIPPDLMAEPVAQLAPFVVAIPERLRTPRCAEMADRSACRRFG